MPRVFQVRGVADVKVAYTVDQSVGLGCTNNRADVLLVQHLLRIAWEDHPTSKGFRPPGETKPLVVDGIWGQTSHRFLKFFQEEAVRRGANVMTDGRADPVGSGGSQGSVSHKFYTILALNAARNSRQRNNQDNISADPGYPAELDKQLYINW